jgi:NAD(P)H dehydrogenase (quinone)
MKTGQIIISVLAALLALAPVAPPQTRRAGEAVKVLVAYHSRTGHTAALAKAVAEGAQKDKQAEVIVKTVAEVKCEELLEADALVVGSPVYWSNMAGEVKTFFDRWTTECRMLPPAFPMRGKVGAAFVTGGEVSSGKEVALLTIRPWAPRPRPAKANRRSPRRSWKRAAASASGWSRSPSRSSAAEVRAEQTHRHKSARRPAVVRAMTTGSR